MNDLNLAVDFNIISTLKFWDLKGLSTYSNSIRDLTCHRTLMNPEDSITLRVAHAHIHTYTHTNYYVASRRYTKTRQKYCTVHCTIIDYSRTFPFPVVFSLLGFSM